MRENPHLHFPLREYRERLSRVHARMAERGMDVLLLTDPCNLYYLSGYDAWSFYVPQALLIECGSDRPVWVGREMDAAGARITTYLEDRDIVTYLDALVQSSQQHPMASVAALARERGWQRARIGVELGSYYLGAHAHEVLKRELPGAAWMDASLLVNWARLVKSPAELRFMREAARIVERAMRVAVERARPGMRQCDVAAEIYRALISGTPEYGGQYPSSPPLMPAAERVNTPHLSWTSAPYQEDSLANFELVAARHRYHAPLARSLYLGRPSAALRTLEAALLDGIAAVIGTLRPGVTAAEVENIWQSAAGRHGVRKAARCGYSIGIAYPPTFGEMTVSLRPGDETVLSENMTLHLMPAVWQQDVSLVITEPLIITARGCEPLCRFERQLFAHE